MLAKYKQDPSECKRYSITWADWLDDGETITDVSFSPLPATTTPLVIDGVQISPDGKATEYYVSGGDAGETYEVVVTATTSGGQIKEDVVSFKIRDSVDV